MERPSPRRHVLYSLIGCLLWIVFVWAETEAYVAKQERAAIGEAKSSVAHNLREITAGLRRSLAVYHGIPAVLATDQGIQKVLESFSPGVKPSVLPYEERKSLWQAHPSYVPLNQNLVAASKAIPAFSAIWVINAAGDTIAASNVNTSESFVGTNYADREYFQAARQGRLGTQFAVGRVTRVPGLFFSAPVNHGKDFFGAVVVKINLSFLDFWVNQANAFVTDPYGVVIMARDKTLEMHALPGSSVNRLTPAQRRGRYLKEDITELSISPWENAQHVDLRYLDILPDPVLMESQDIVEEGLTVTVMHPLAAMSKRTASHTGLFLAIASTGLVLIAILSSSIYFVGNRRRVRRYEQQQQHVEYIATHDTLTGMYSRVMSEQLILQGMALSDRSGRAMAVMFVDLDLFKNINDTMGHDAGDDVLREVARRLRREVRAADAVIRQGGDEFLLVLNDLDCGFDAAQIAQKLIDAIGQAFVISDVQLKLSVSIGIAVYPSDGDTPSKLVRNADSALYHAKENGRADYNFYLESMNADSLARILRVNALRHAVENREFELHFQPQFDLRSRQVMGCEALIRWRHPEEGLLQAKDFIPLAEKSGLVVQIDEWVLHESCRKAQAWRQQLASGLRVAVNISPMHFRKMGLVDRVRRALAESGLAPEGLELELKEVSIMEDLTRSTAILSELEALGVGVSIEDFDAGYSSLTFLKRFKTNVIKIDRTFVNSAAENSPERSIAGAIIQMAKSIGCRAIAEGVEDEGQADIFEHLGCDLAQGYGLSRPLCESDFYDFVASSRALIRSEVPVA